MSKRSIFPRIAIVVGLATTWTASLSIFPGLEFNSREFVAGAAFPVVWLIMAAVFAFTEASLPKSLSRSLGLMFVMLAISQIVQLPHAASNRVPSTLSVVLGVTSMVVILFGSARTYRATNRSVTRQTRVLQFELRSAMAALEAERLIASRRTHDQRSAVLSVDAVLQLLQDDRTNLDAVSRQRLTEAAKLELARMRASFADRSVASELHDADLMDLIGPVIAVAQADGAHLTSEIRGGLIVHVSGQALIDVVRNLISNAVHHGGNRAISISASRVSYEFVELGVSDYGPGIASARRFDLFEAGRSSGGPDHFGLGLHSARSLLREMGGDLTLDRSFPGGARFVAIIPAGVENGVKVQDRLTVR